MMRSLGLIKRWIRHSDRGHAVTEVALISPWIFFLFIGTLDFGFYAYWMIATANASRSAALAAARLGPDQAVACKQVLNEMRGVFGWDTANSAGTCNGTPLFVTVRELDDDDDPDTGDPTLSADLARSVVVSVAYETRALIPVPGIVDTFTIRQDTEIRLQ